MFLSQTKQAFSFMKFFQFYLGYNNLFTIDPCGASGDLTLIYNNIFNVNILFASNIILDVEADIQENKVFIYFLW